MKILFLCTGNTCRSPMAEAVFNKKVRERNLNFTAGSAGINAFPGDRASENAIAVMKEREINISSHRSRRFSVYMAHEYDCFVCMSSEQRDAVVPFVGEDRILMCWEIWDPFDDSMDIYRLCADKIERETDRFIDLLCQIMISPMKSEDIPFVAEIEKECFSAPWSENALREELDNENAIFFVASQTDTVVGYMGMHTVLDECYVANVAVKQKFRRRGIGKKLLQYAEKKATEKGCSFISLEVRVSNESAIALYSAEGYERVGERKDFYTDPKENALIMTKYLK